MTLYCTGCKADVAARLTTGQEIYPHRPDLYNLPFWICDTCKGYVGCHHKTKQRTRPLGVIASKEIMEARKKLHALIDPIWKSKKMKRREVYAYISYSLGYQYHSGEIRSLEEARRVWKIAAELCSKLGKN